MAHFVGEIQGNKRLVWVLGSKKSGIKAHLRGRNIGCRVVCQYNENTGEDDVYIFKTGVNGEAAEELITRF